MRYLLSFLLGLCLLENLSAQKYVNADTIKKWNSMSIKFTKINNYTEALKYCDMLIEADSNNCKYLGLKAAIYSSIEQYYKSEALIIRQLKQGCDSIKCYIALSKIHRYQENYIKAKEYIDKAIILKPDSANIYIERATIFMFLKDKQNKVKDLQRAKSLGSDEASELLNGIESYP